MTDIEKLKEIIEESNNIVFFSGAGVSTESNIPDFRSDDGIYNKQKKKYGYPAEYMLSHSYFVNHTEEFYDFYFHEMIYKDAKPNEAHKALARLEKSGKLKAVITQNIDNLHQAGGVENVIELHGSVYRNYCTKCHKKYSLDELMEKGYQCSCGGTIKPDVVLYEEPLEMKSIEKAIHYISTAEVLIVAGTSLSVFPASGMIQYFKGKHMVIINMQATELDRYFELIIRDKVGSILSKVIK